MKTASFLFLLLCASLAYTQPRYGMRVGAVWSYGNQNAVSEAITYSSSIVSFSGGLFTDIELDRQWWINVGVNYEEREVKYDAEVVVPDAGIFAPTQTFTATDKFKYITLPVFLEYSPIDRLGISTGPQLGVLLDVETEVLTFGNFDTSEFASDIDLSWGLGVELQGEKTSVGIRYHLGLLDLNDEPLEGSQYKINTLNAYVAVHFN